MTNLRKIKLSYYQKKQEKTGGATEDDILGGLEDDILVAIGDDILLNITNFGTKKPKNRSKIP